MRIGNYRVEILPDSEFRLDGGAMFGVVPRVVWEKSCAPDELNRIRMNMNCLFVETATERILVETGIGEKWSEDEAKRFGIFRERPFAETIREKTGYGPDDISIVVNTHLHFDHAGGNTILVDGRTVPQFRNARYLVSKSEYEAAENPTERDRASYRAENWRPLVESGQLELMPDSYEVVDGLRLDQVRGHSATMQTVELTRAGETLFGFADLIPTTAHLPYAWIMGYDLFPLETLAAKKDLLPRAVAEKWICLFYHDFERPLCRLASHGSKIVPAD
ncbi:MAG: MBL fold metallo-hydrolase [Acidobacteria bacterium]|nr:MBL fold metallo-hydrolase [Acidobacteriota bacterium]